MVATPDRVGADALPSKLKTALDRYVVPRGATSEPAAVARRLYAIRAYATNLLNQLTDEVGHGRE